MSADLPAVPIVADAPTRFTPRPAPLPSSEAPAATATGTLEPPPEGRSVFAAEDVLAERYRIVRFLAQGGMGEVYEAEDLELREHVALKTISAHRDRAAALDRFKREIQLARKVSHPNVCRIFDLGQHRSGEGASAVLFLTMELLRGETLRDRLKERGRMTTAEVLPIARQIAYGLHAAHKARIIHRDLKSENIFLVPDESGLRVVVTDFGIARGGGEDDHFAALVTGGGILGTPAYMAPEQVRGKQITPAADLYAFGVVLYEMLTAKLPYKADNPLAVAVKRLQEEPAPPSTHVPDLDVRWERAILRCLERSPGKRFATAIEVVQSLENRAAETSTVAPTAVATGTSAGDFDDPNSPSRSLAGAAVEVDATGSSSRTISGTVPMSGGESPPSFTEPSPTGTLAEGKSSASFVAAGQAPAAVASQEPVGGRRGRRLVYALLGVLVLSGALALFNRLYDPDSRRRVVPRRSVAVLGLENAADREDLAWMSTALSEMLATELARGDVLRTIPGERVAQAAREPLQKRELETDEIGGSPDTGPGAANSGGGEGEGVDDGGSLARLHALLGCDFVVLGSYAGAGGRIRIDLRLADAARGAVLASVGRDGTEDEIFDLVAALGNELREHLGVDAGSSEDPLSGLPRDRRAARLYAEALEHLRGARPLEARDLLRQAATAEAGNPLIHSALSMAAESLGYGREATEHAERAFELSSDLPREDRLSVEGRFREVQQDWPAAIAAYRQLWDYFPDELEYGLRLAAAETSARRPDDAARTLGELRSLPAPLSEDLRIDLAEASVSGLVADYPAQLEAAGRAASGAEAVGAVLLLAQARLAEAQAARLLGQPEDAAAAAAAARAAYRDLGNRAGEAMSIAVVANVHLDRADLDAADASYTEALEIYRELGNRGGAAAMLNSQAVTQRQRGELDSAQRLYEDVEKIYRDTGDEAGLVNVMNNLGVLLVHRGALSDAKARFAAALDVWEENGDRSGTAFALNNIAVVLREQGELGESRMSHERALSIRREIGQRIGEIYSLSNLAALFGDLGELGRARENAVEARRLAEEIGHRSSRAQATYELAELDRLAGELESAQALHTEALEARRELEERLAQIDSQIALARVALESDQPAAAEIGARRAITLCHREGHDDGEAMASAVLSLAFLAQGKRGEARQAAEQAELLAAGSERRTVRFWAELAGAQVLAATGRRAPAAELLAALEDQAMAAGYATLPLEARLARAEILGGGEGDALRAEVRGAAEAHGFAALAARAGR